MSDSSDQDEDRDFKKSLYAKRGRRDSLGQDSQDDHSPFQDDADDVPYNPLDADQPFVRKKRDTFQLRRGT